MTIPTEPIGVHTCPGADRDSTHSGDVDYRASEEIRDRILEAANYHPIEQLGTTDDGGFSPFSDDTSTSRDTAFAKIRARVLGTALPAEIIEDR